HQKIGQTGVREIIVLRYRDRVGPKRLAVAPIRDLRTRYECKSKNHDDCARGGDLHSESPTREKIDNAPSDHQQKTNLRQERITMGVGLQVDLNKADDWRDHDQIPKPADNEIWAGFAQRENSDCNQKRGSGDRLPRRQTVW